MGRLRDRLRTVAMWQNPLHGPSCPEKPLATLFCRSFFLYVFFRLYMAAVPRMRCTVATLMLIPSYFLKYPLVMAEIGFSVIGTFLPSGLRLFFLAHLALQLLVFYPGCCLRSISLCFSSFLQLLP